MPVAIDSPCLGRYAARGASAATTHGFQPAGMLSAMLGHVRLPENIDYFIPCFIQGGI